MQASRGLLRDRKRPPFVAGAVDVGGRAGVVTHAPPVCLQGSTVPDLASRGASAIAARDTVHPSLVCLKGSTVPDLASRGASAIAARDTVYPSPRLHTPEAGGRRGSGASAPPRVYHVPQIESVGLERVPVATVKGKHGTVRVWGGPPVVSVYREDVIIRPEVTWEVRARGERQRITEFSGASRAAFAHVAGNGPPVDVEICLTYPGAWESLCVTGEGIPKVKYHLKVFLKWLSRRNLWGVWILEFQSRGAPHFHIMAGRKDGEKVGEGELLGLRAFIAGEWYTVVGSGLREHYLAGTSCDTIRSQGGLRGYLGKYLQKDAQKASSVKWPGRYWGRFGGYRVAPVSVLEGRAASNVARASRRYRRAVGARRWKWGGTTKRTIWGAGRVILARLERADGPHDAAGEV